MNNWIVGLAEKSQGLRKAFEETLYLYRQSSFSFGREQYIDFSLPTTLERMTAAKSSPNKASLRCLTQK